MASTRPSCCWRALLFATLWICASSQSGTSALRSDPLLRSAPSGDATAGVDTDVLVITPKTDLKTLFAVRTQLFQTLYGFKGWCNHRGTVYPASSASDSSRTSFPASLYATPPSRQRSSGSNSAASESLSAVPSSERTPPIRRILALTDFVSSLASSPSDSTPTTSPAHDGANDVATPGTPSGRALRDRRRRVEAKARKLLQEKLGASPMRDGRSSTPVNPVVGGGKKRAKQAGDDRESDDSDLDEPDAKRSCLHG